MIGKSQLKKSRREIMIYLTIKRSAWLCLDQVLELVFVLLSSTGMLWDNYGKILIYPFNIEERIETSYIAVSTGALGFQKFFIFGVMNISSFIWTASKGEMQKKVSKRRERYDSVSLETGSIQPWEENAQGTPCCYVQLHGERIQRCPGSSWSFTTVGLATTNPSWKMENSH